MTRTDVVLIMMLAALTIMIAGVADAGTQDDPEIWDEGEPDGDNGGGTYDIISAWFWGEDDAVIECTLLLHSLPPVQSDLDAVEYEVYVATAQGNFSFVANFTFGTGVTDPSYEIRTVTYDENGSVAHEVRHDDLDGTWSSSNNTITYHVLKDTIGAARGEPLNRTWAAVWLTPALTGTRSISDEARNYTEPGRDYFFQGVSLTARSFDETAQPGDTVIFTFDILNPGSKNITLLCNHSYDWNWRDYHAEKWPVSIEIDGTPRTGTFELTLLAGTEAAVMIAIQVPDDPASNVVIDGKPALPGTLVLEYDLFNGTEHVREEVNYQVLVNESSSGGGGDDTDGDDGDEGLIFGLKMWQLAAIVVIVVVVIAIIVRAIIV